MMRLFINLAFMLALLSVSLYASDPISVDTDGDGIGDKSDVYPKSEIVRGYQFLQTSSTSANITSLHVLNTSDGEQSFSALMFDGTGDRVGGTPLAVTRGGSALPDFSLKLNEQKSIANHSIF